MKLIIQIPCYNEETSLPVTLAELPREIEGIDCVEWLIIDDGSRDKTVEVAKACGVDHIVRLPSNKGLAVGFMEGIKACIHHGADIIVNTDADNQYCSADIVKLIEPILGGDASIVVGARPIQNIESFSWIKKCLQRLGSFVVRAVSTTQIPDAPSGFRAFSRDAALQLNVFSEYTYTLETIIQAGHKGIDITSVPVRVNHDLRPSRLVKSLSSYVNKSMVTIFRIFAIYRPFKFFMTIGGVLFGLGFLLGLRFMWFYFIGEGSGHVQSVILASILLGMGTQTILVAFLADLIAVNRKLLEDIQYENRSRLIPPNVYSEEGG